MDKHTFEQHIIDQPQHVKTEGVIRYNALIATMKAYNDAPTAARDKDWKAAQESLEAFVRTLHPEESDRFANLAAVLAYLDGAGWKISKSSLYRDRKAGMFLPQNDGTFLQKDIDRYAKAELKEKATGMRVQTKIDELHRKKAELEAQNLEVDLKRKQLQYERDMEKYIPKEQVEIELAARAGILDAGLKHWVQSRAADWIRAVDGNTKKIGELINLMNRELDEHVNSYAAAREYEIIIEAE